MEPVEVTAHFDDQGNIIPQKFIWQGSQYTVTSTGRSWSTHDQRHVLVMTPGDRVFELIFLPAQGVWYLRRPYSPRQMA